MMKYENISTKHLICPPNFGSTTRKTSGYIIKKKNK